MQDIATTTLTGNLTRDVELRALPSGADVARLRVATNIRRRSGEEWVDKANYFTVDVFGGQARACAQYLRKGSRIAIEAEPDWHEWTDKSTGATREAVTFKARKVLFLDPGSHNNRQSNDQASSPASPPATPDTVTAAPQPAAATTDGAGTATADDLPF